MNKTCSRCQKTVYPIEELKCLDKVWHKGCFKCQECGMTLNMKTYKGYGKLPYCEAHIPKAKHTTMAETPELRRIAENTKLQSNVMYHADFERSKGKFTQVADDPETLRIKQNTQIISNVAYHGDLAKKAAMEKQRALNENGELVELPTPDNYDIQIESYDPEIRQNSAGSVSGQYQQKYPSPSDVANSNQAYRQPKNEPKYSQQQKYEQPKYEQQPRYDNQQRYEQPGYDQRYNQSQYEQPKYDQQQPKYYEQQPKYDQQQPKYDHQPKYDQQQPKYDQQQPKYDQQQPKYDQQQPKYQYQPDYNKYQPKYEDYARQSRDMIQKEQQYPGNSQYQPPQQQRIGKIEDYDPVTDGPRQQVFTQRPSATLIYNSSTNNGRGAHTQQQQIRRPIGNVSNLDPLANETHPTQHHQQNQHQHERQHHTPISAKVYIAMYDYEARDTDEVSFLEGDLISNVTSIDEGWMTGQVLRTGRTGMLPANYVELAPM